MENNSDKIISKVLALHILLLWGKIILMNGVPFVYRYQTYVNLIVVFVVVCLYMCVLWKTSINLKRISIALIIDVFLIISCVITFVIFPQNIGLIKSNMVWFIVYCLLPLHFIVLLEKFDYLIMYMKQYSYIIVCFAVVSAIYIHRMGHTTTSSWSSYSMPLSYGVLYAVMWLLMDFFYERKILALFFAVIGSFIMFFYGARNTLLALIVYILWMMVLKMRFVNTAKIYFWFWCAIFVVLIIIRQILSVMSSVLEILGIESRTLALIVSGKGFTYDSRGEIHQKILECLNDYPISGLGIWGDTAQSGEMSHNLYLSILSNFGYVVGGVLIIALVFVWIYNVMRTKGNYKAVAIVYICMVVPRSFTGGDIWNSDVFWWLLGVCIVGIRSVRNRTALINEQEDRKSESINYRSWL